MPSLMPTFLPTPEDAAGETCSSAIRCSGDTFCSDVNEIGKPCEPSDDTCICVRSAAPTPKPTSNVGTDIDVWQAAGGVVGARLARLDPSAVDPGAKLVLAPNVTSADAIATAFSWKIYDAASPGTALSLGGSSGVVGASSEFLVLPAGFLSHKSSYTFQLTETRGSGASSSSTLELVVRPANPPNGSLAVNVAAANTTVRDLFVLRAENWTTWQDRNDTLYYRRTADDYPLTYRFVYAVGVGGSGDNATTVRPPSHDNTTATVLPLGRRSGGGASSHYGLVVRVVVTSSLGGIGVASREVTVAPPALGNAVAVSSGAVATLQSFIDDDKILRAAVLLNAQATLLNHVVESSDASAAQVTAALSARASLVGYANTVALRSETVDSVEASTVALASLTSAARSSVSASEQRSLIGALWTLTNRSSTNGGLGSMSAVAAEMCFAATSQLLQTPNALDRGGSGGGAYGAWFDDALVFLGDAIAQGRAPGEDTVYLESKEVAVTARSVNRQYLYLTAPLTVSPSTAAESSRLSRYRPSFELPWNLLNGGSALPLLPGVQHRVSLATTDWSNDPYRKQATTTDAAGAGVNGRDGRRLQKNSTVTRLTVGLGRYDADLPSPVTLKLPLPLQQSAQYVATKQQHNLTCKDERSYDDDKRRSSQMDKARYNHCMKPQHARFGKTYSRSGPYVYQNHTVFCDEISTEYFMKCTNETGNMTLTCPMKYYIARASTWNDAANAWEPNDNCSVGSVDFGSMYATFTCSRLGSITAQLHDRYTAPTWALTEVSNATRIQPALFYFIDYLFSSRLLTLLVLLVLLSSLLETTLL